MTHEPILLTFACGEDLSICSILRMPTLMSTVLATIDLAEKLMHTPAWTCGSLPIIFRESPSASLPMTKSSPVSILTRHTASVHAACEALLVNHVQHTHEVRTTSSSTSGYGALYLRLNPLPNTSKRKTSDAGVDFVADSLNAMSVNGYG